MARGERKGEPSAGAEPGVRLSRERILEAAVKVVAREGLDALSMRRLAQELDVWPMSVYRYFRDKDELLDAVVGRAAERVSLPSERGSWKRQLRDLLRRTRELLDTDAPGLRGQFPRALLTPGVMRFSEAGLRILREAGFGNRDAARAWRALLSYTLGFQGFAAADASGDWAQRVRTAIASLAPEDYPMLAANADAVIAVLVADSEFDWGLERLLDGLELTLDRAAAPSR
jgi:TetR/AcrR family transcriptional regulator, tetracycline repressor protein